MTLAQIVPNALLWGSIIALVVGMVVENRRLWK